MIDLNITVATGRVTGRFIVGMADGPDLGDAPDVIPAEGTVTFTPNVPYIPSAVGAGAVTVLPAPVVGMLDYEGYLCAPDADGVLEGRRGVRLIATDDEAGAVQNWTWSVSYQLEGAGRKFPVPTHSMALPAGAVVDLAGVVKVPASPGVGTDQAIALIAVAQEAADAAATAALAAAESAAAAVAAAAANDQGVSGLVNTPASLTRQAVQSIADASSGAKIPSSQKGAANGVATLGADSKVPAALLPPMVQSVAGKSGAVALTKADVGLSNVKDLASTPNASESTIVERDASGLFVVATPTAGGHPTTKTYVDGTVDTKIDAKLVRPLLADGTDLNALNTTAHVGTYAVGGTLLNGPPVSLPSTGSLEIGRSTDFGMYQRITAGVTMWFREAINASAQTWFTWTQVATLDTAGKVPVAQLPAATTSTAGTMSAADKSKLDAASQSAVNDALIKRDATGLFTVNTPTANWHPTRKDYVDNALALKAPLASPAFTGNPTGITKTHVGLANVDNTADSAKPVATASVNGLMSATDKTKLDGATSAPTPATVAYRNGLGRIQVAEPGTDTAAATPKSYVDKFKVLPNIKDFGAMGDGATSDTAAINAALATGKTVVYPEGYYPNTTDSTFYLYTDQRNRSGGVKYGKGVPGTPTTDWLPILQVDKTSNSQRVEGGPAYWDSAFYANLTMEPTMTALGSAITGRVRTSSAKDGIGVTGSGLAMGAAGRAWGVWAYASSGDDGSGQRASQLAGVEVNVNNTISDQPRDGYLPAGEGPARGVIIVTADFSKRCGIGLDIGAQAGSKGWWTGIRLRADGVEPDGATQATRGEQIDLQGATTSGAAYAGLRLSQGNFSVGIDLTGGSYAGSNAIALDTSDRISFGPTANNQYVTGNGTLFDVRGMNIGVAGTKVVGGRRTGWGATSAFTGTKTRTGYDTTTVTTPQLAERLAALIEDLQNHGLIGA